MRSLARRTVAVLTVAALALLLWKMRAAALTLGLAVLIASSLEPLIAAGIRRCVPRWLAASLVYLGVGLILGGTVALALALLPDELRRLGEGMQHAFAALRARWPETAAALLPASLEGALDGFSRTLLDASTGALEGTFHVCLALILSFCWALGSDSLERLSLSLLPARERAGARQGWDRLVGAAGRQLRADAAQSLVALLLLAALLTLLRVPYATVAALGIALLRVVPLFGLAGAVGLAFACGAAHSLPRGLVAALCTLALLVAVAHLIGRRIAPAQPPRLIVAVGLLLGFEVAGPLGLLLVPMVAALLAALLEHLFTLREVPPAAEVPLAALHARLWRLRGRLNDEESPPRPEVASLVARLDELVGETAAHRAPGRAFSPTEALSDSSARRRPAASRRSRAARVLEERAMEATNDNPPKEPI